MEEQDAFYCIISEKARTRSYVAYMEKKAWMIGSVIIGLPNFVLVIFLIRSECPAEVNETHIYAIIDSDCHKHNTSDCIEAQCMRASKKN